MTGTFARAAPTIRLWTEGEKEALNVTANHPVYSVDREDWVAAGELELGEALQTPEGTTRVEEIEAEPGAIDERVFTLEVAGTHAFFVGKAGIWVHNGCVNWGNVAAEGGRLVAKNGTTPKIT